MAKTKDGDTETTWVKFNKSYGEEHKPGDIVQMSKVEAAVLCKADIAEEVDAPKEMADESAKMVKAIDERINTAVEVALEKLAKTISVKSGNKRPVITNIHDREDDDPTDGFRSHGEFVKSVVKACSNQGVDERLRRKAPAGANEGTSGEGGYATPVQFATNVYEDVLQQDSLMNDCFLIPMNSNSIKLPAINFTNQSDFGVTSFWEGEGNTIPTSQPKYRQPQLTLNKLTTLCPVTSELLEDGISIEPIINMLAAESIVFKINDAILRGTGAGMPVGIIGHPSVVNIAPVGGQSPDTVIAQNVLQMRKSMWTRPGGKPKFLINKEVEEQLLTIQDPGGRYLYFAPGSFAQQVAGSDGVQNFNSRGRLLGYDVQPVVNCSALGDVGDIILADLRGYAFGYKTAGISKAISIHLYFDSDQVAMRWTFRADGRCWRDTTLAAANGSAVYGPIVTLQNR